MAKVTVEIRNNIVSMLSNGQSIREVSNKVGVGKSTVQEIRAKYVPDIPELSPGRPRKLSVQDKRHCVRSVTSGRIPTATAATKRLKDELKVSVNANTVRRALKEAGLKAKKSSRSQISQPRILRKDYSLQRTKKTGQKPIGSGLFGLMKLRSIVFVLMACPGAGRVTVLPFKIIIFKNAQNSAVDRS